jgi:hypothetical protein
MINLPAIIDTKPDLIILCWDSDCMNVIKSLQSSSSSNNKEEAKLKLKSNFKTNLKLLIQSIIQAGIYLISKF